MDLDEVKVCLRALLSSTPVSYCLNSLLIDFKSTTGFSLPLFGYRNPVEFLKSLKDTVQLRGSSCNPEVALIESQKSAHIISLVDRQKANDKSKSKNHYFAARQRRQIVPARQVESLGNSVGSSVACSNAYCNSNSDWHRNGTRTSPLILSSNCSQNFTNNIADLQKKIMPPEEEIHSFTAPHAPQSPQSVTAPYVMRNLVVEPKPQNLFTQKIISMLPPNTSQSEAQVQTQVQTQTDISVLEPSENKKTDTCCCADVSCNDSFASTKHSEDYSDQALSTSNGFVNDGIKNKLKELIKIYPNGLWCCDLPQLFFEKYLFVLDYREFGYTSLIQMLSELPDVFRCVRPGNEDWILFDASASPSFVEGKIKEFQRRGDLLRKMRANLQKLFFKSPEDPSASNIEVDKVAELYQKTFGETLDIESLGFKDLRSLLESWEESGINIYSVNGKFFCGPAPATRTVCPRVRWEEALPPITAENDIFVEIFPKEVVGPEDSLVKLDLTRHIVVGQVIEVCIAEVWSPSKFFIQLNKFKSRLNRFMEQLQKFYNIYLNKYKMPDSTIRPNQICVGLYNADPEFPDEWHRAQILKVINEKVVLINFVDYGTVTRVKKSQLRFLHRSFQSFPIQACQAHLSGVAPPDDETTWPMTTSKKFLELLRQPHLNAEIMDIDFQTPSLSVVLFDPFQKQKWNINEKLVLERLAKVKDVEREANFCKEDISVQKMKTFKPKKEETKSQSEFSWSVSPQTNESLTEIAPQTTDLFLDVDELHDDETKSLALDPCSPPDRRPKVPEPKEPRNTNASGEFEEIPELKSCYHLEGNALQTNKKKTLNEVITEQVTTQSVLSATRHEKERSAEDEKKPNFPAPSPPAGQNLAPSAPPPPPAFPAARKPPGLEHMNPRPDLARLPFLLRPEDLRRKINVLAMELFTNNSAIKQVGVNDPVLALKIATEMAEALVSSQLSLSLPLYLGFPLNVGSRLPGMLMNGVSTGDLEGGEKGGEGKGVGGNEREDGYVSGKETGADECAARGGDEKSTVKVSSEKEAPRNFPNVSERLEVVSVGGKTVHVVGVGGEAFVCAEEIVRQFTLFSSREVADRVLHIRKITPEYKIIDKNSHEGLLLALKNSDLPGVAKKRTKKLKIYLLRANKVVPFLQALGCRTKPFESDFVELLKNWEDKKSEEAEFL